MDAFKVKVLMAKQGLTTQELSRRAGVAYNVIYLALKGRKKTTLVSIGKIAKALGVEPDEIMVEE